MLKPTLLEFIGSFALTFLCMACRAQNPDDYFTLGLTYFFLFGALIYAFQNVSGSHFNPVLTISLLLTSQISLTNSIAFLASQLTGSLLASALAINVLPFASLPTVPSLRENMRYSGLVVEMLVLFSLVLVYNCLVANFKAPRYVLGVSVASVYLLGALCFGGLSGAAFNLIFLFGPGIASGKYGDWVL